MSKIKRIYKKAIDSPILMTWTNYFTVFLHGVIITPLTLKYLSSPDYSFWALQQTIIGLALLADSGFGQTTQRAVSFFYEGASRLPKTLEDYKSFDEKSGEPNKEKLMALLSTSSRIHSFLTILVVTVISSIGFLSLQNVISMSDNPDMLKLSFGVMILISIVAIQNMKWTSFMKGIRKIALLQRYSTIMNLFKTLSFFIIILINPQVIYFISVLLVSSSIGFFFFRSNVLKWFKERKITRYPKFFDKEIFDSMWTSTWRMGISQWGYFFSKFGTDLIIAQLRNAPLIAGYLFTKKILQFIRKLSEATVQARLPEHYSKMAVKKYREVKQKLSADIFLTGFLQVFGYTAFALLAVPLFNVLDIDKGLVPVFVFIVMALTEFLDSYSWIHGTIYVSTNHVPFMIPTVINGTVILLLSYLVMNNWGILGIIVIKFLVQLGFINWYAPYLNLNLLNWKFKSHVTDVVKNGSMSWFNKIKLTLSKL